MHRLFVGIDPPQSLKAEVGSSQIGVAAARWQRAEQLHITLRFIGEVDRRMANDIAIHLTRIHHPAFELQCQGVGTFDKRGIVHTLYAKVQPAEPCFVLHKKLDFLLVQLGLPHDARAYVPHLTLARLNAASGTLAHFMEVQGALRTSAFLVKDVCLYESSLTRDGAHYQIVARYPLMTDQTPQDALTAGA